MRKEAVGVEGIKERRGKEKKGERGRCQYSYNCQCTDNLLRLWGPHQVDGKSWSHSVISEAKKAEEEKKEKK